MTFPINLGQKILATTTIALIAFPHALANAQAQSSIDTDGILVAQKLGTIEKKIELSEVPATVLSTAIAATGGQPAWAQVQINPNGSTVYELGGQNQQGFDFEIEINPNGEIIEIDEQVEASAVPEEVMKAFNYWLSDAQIVSTWRSTRYTSFDYYYEIVIGDDFWVEIPADGTTVKIMPL